MLEAEAPGRVRVLLLSPDRRLLLINYRNTDRSGTPMPCWLTPGGGLEPGETLFEAAAREVEEEAGITDVQIGPVVWYGEDSRRSGDWNITFKEHFVVATSPSEAFGATRWTDHEMSQILGMRWWTLEELQRSADVIYPRGLAGLLEPLLQGRYPSKMLVLGQS